MKKIFVVYIMVFLIPMDSYCSWLSTFRHLSKTFQQTNTLTELKEKILKNNKDFRIKDTSTIIDRQLDFDCSQITYEIEVYYKGDIYFASRANLLVRNDTILYGILQLLNYDNKTMLKSNFKNNKDAIATYINQHRQFYDSNITTIDFKNNFSKQLIFGFGCSFSQDGYSNEAKKMLKYVSSNNQKELTKWLRQINPELQAYGAVGLLRLEKQGIKLTDKDSLIFNYLKKRDTKIYSCSGCIYGLKFALSGIMEAEDK